MRAAVTPSPYASCMHGWCDDAIQGSMTAGSHMARYRETQVVESCRHMTRHESFVIGSTNWWADFRKKQWAFPTIHSSCASIRFKMSNNNTCSANSLKSFSMLLCWQGSRQSCKALSPREYDYS
jgi:hypothetical protein